VTTTDIMPLALDAVRDRLAAYEQVEDVYFAVGEQLRFDSGQGWQFGGAAEDPLDPVDVWITVGGGRASAPSA
jgi:hypothetical protein